MIAPSSAIVPLSSERATSGPAQGFSAFLDKPINQISPLNIPRPSPSTTPFDSQGQTRALTISRFEDLPQHSQAEVCELMACASPRFYGNLGFNQLAGIMRDTHTVATVTIQEPVELPAGPIRAAIVVPAGVPIPAGTILPAPPSDDASEENTQLLPTATVQDRPTRLPAGTVLGGPVTLPPGTIAGAATLTYKMASKDGELFNVAYLGQVLGHNAIPGGGGQATRALLDSALAQGRTVIASTDDPVNFHDLMAPSSDGKGKPGLYSKSPAPTFGSVWPRPGEAAAMRFRNFDTTAPGSLPSSLIDGISVMAGQRTPGTSPTIQAREAAGLPPLPVGTRFLFGWVPPGGTKPDFVWRDDTAQRLGGTVQRDNPLGSSQPVSRTWGWHRPAGITPEQTVDLKAGGLGAFQRLVIAAETPRTEA